MTTNTIFWCVSIALFFKLMLATTASAMETCGNFSQQINTTGFLDNFTTIEIGPLECPMMRGRKAIAVPAAIFWHIIPLPGANLSVTANIEGLVIPFVNDGVLSFAYGNAIPFQRGQQAGVQVVLPTGNFTTISSTGVSNSVEITDTFRSLKFLQDRGVNNGFYVTSTSDIQYAADSLNGTAQIDAPNVVVKMGGIGGDVHVKGSTNAEMSGLGNTLVVQGNATVSTPGVESNVIVNGMLDSISDTGVNNTFEMTDATVTVADLDCVGPMGTSACNDNATVLESSSATMACVCYYFGGLAVACIALVVSLL